MSQTTKLYCNNENKKSSNIKKKWNQNEIDLLKEEFKNGTRIKIIASKLGKTETAVNKFLTRCGIRPKYRIISSNHKCKLNINKIHTCNNTSAKWLSLFNNVVDFKDVIKYLKSKGYKISNIVTDSIKLFYPNSEYVLDGRPVSKTKLLILANKLREAENKKTFKLEYIM